MAKTPKEFRPKSTEPYHKQETARNMTEDTMQAAWKDITDRLQRMERKELQKAADMKELQDLYQTEKNANNARQACSWNSGTGQERDASEERSDSKTDRCDKHTKSENSFTDADGERMQCRVEG